MFKIVVNFIRDFRKGYSANRLVVIGFLGGKCCYLNVSKAEAIRRYEKSEEYIVGGGGVNVEEFEFDDEFWAYDAAPLDTRWLGT